MFHGHLAFIREPIRPRLETRDELMQWNSCAECGIKRKPSMPALLSETRQPNSQTETNLNFYAIIPDQINSSNKTRKTTKIHEMENQNAEKQKKMKQLKFHVGMNRRQSQWQQSRSSRRGSKIKKIMQQSVMERMSSEIARPKRICCALNCIYSFSYHFYFKISIPAALPLPNGTVPLMMIMMMKQSDRQGSPSSWIPNWASSFGIGMGESSFPALLSPSCCNGMTLEGAALPNWHSQFQLTPAVFSPATVCVSGIP